MGVKHARQFFLVLCLMGVSWWLPAQTPPTVTGEKANFRSGSYQPEWPLEAFLFSPGQVSHYQSGPIEDPRVDGD